MDDMRVMLQGAVRAQPGGAGLDCIEWMPTHLAVHYPPELLRAMSAADASGRQRIAEQAALSVRQALVQDSDFGDLDDALALVVELDRGVVDRSGHADAHPPA